MFLSENKNYKKKLTLLNGKVRVGTLTHIRLTAVCSASVTAHFGWLH